MGLLAQASRQAPPIDPRRRCGVGEWVATLDEEDRAELSALLDKGVHHIDGWNMEKALVICKGAGLGVQYSALRRHANGLCVCAVLNG